MLFSNDRTRLRRYYRDVWQKQTARQPLEPLEQLIAAAIAQHPEYHALFSGPETELERDDFPEFGPTNPFLHLGLHIALREQLTGNRPAGIIDIFAQLSRRHGASHAAEHRMIECLGETLWEAQQNGVPPDETRYLARLRRLIHSD